MEPSAETHHRQRWKLDGVDGTFYAVTGLASLLVPYDGSLPPDVTLFSIGGALAFNALRGRDIGRDGFGARSFAYRPMRAVKGLVWTGVAYGIGIALRYAPHAYTLAMRLTERS